MTEETHQGGTPRDGGQTTSRELDWLRHAATPAETAERIGQKYDVALPETARRTLPKDAFDALWESEA